jgi:hypothetical protein
MVVGVAFVRGGGWVGVVVGVVGMPVLVVVEEGRGGG